MIGLVFLWSRLLPRRRLIDGARLTTGRFLCRLSYSFPASISPISSIDIYDKSLYEAEESANKFETELIQAKSPAYPISGGGIAISRERVSLSMASSTTIRILS